MYKSKNLASEHINNHAAIYFFMLVLFLIGIIFGAVIVNSMNFAQKEDLFFYIDRFFGQIMEGPVIEKKEMFKSTFLYHLNYLLLLFVLGLSIIGLPIIWILLFVKGLVVGFSVGFFVNQMGWQGLLLAAASIAPQNLLIIPVYLVAGSLAMIFSLTLLRKIFTRKLQQPIIQPFLRYISLYLSLLVVIGLAALIESFVSNEAMELVIQWMYK
ncbi:stage II sporulation protein M [Aquibacillus rhizosphaerae]|uniref:Stage II sporulation protein M n=1 Tax=Aquibacillus rhizosphaerae TaxID=3051431 RepID=A0ABT7L4E0_9BACI|nr:stage II sporulation protein M [Aquibacillus sp. LR5S19]MDL4840731.1 stage II sporulation protein M [Aquibacillus sp. LR5S19]